MWVKICKLSNLGIISNLVHAILVKLMNFIKISRNVKMNNLTYYLNMIVKGIRFYYNLDNDKLYI